MKRLVDPSVKEPSKSIKWNSFRNFAGLFAAGISEMMRLIS
jgi:hypothetical protein